MLHKDSETKNDKKEERHPIYLEDCVPIVLHYFTGGSSILTSFGHIGLQLGRYYLSHGQGDATSHDLHKSLVLFTHYQIKEEYKKYGGIHVTLELPIPKNMNPHELITEWLTKFTPQNYSIHKNNCCHAVAWLAARLNYIKVITAQLGILRPYDVANALFKYAYDIKRKNGIDSLTHRIQSNIDILSIELEETRMNSEPFTKFLPLLDAVQIQRTLCFGIHTDHLLHSKEYKVALSPKKPFPISKEMKESHEKNLLLSKCIAHYQELATYNTSLHINRTAPYYHLLMIFIEKIHHQVITAKDVATTMKRYQSLLVFFQQLEQLYSTEKLIIQFEQLAQETRNLVNPGNTTHFDFDKTEKIHNIKSITAILRTAIVDLNIDTAIKAIQATKAGYDIRMRDLKSVTAVDQKTDIQLKTHAQVKIIHNQAIMNLLRFLIDDLYFWERKTIDLKFFVTYYHLEKMFYLGFASAHEVINETLTEITQLGAAKQSPLGKKVYCIHLFINNAINYGDAKAEDAKKSSSTDELLESIKDEIHNLPSNIFSNYLKITSTQLILFAHENLITIQFAALKLKAIAEETATALHKELSPIAGEVDKIAAKLKRSHHSPRKPPGSVLFNTAPFTAATSVDETIDEQVAFEM